MLIQFVIYLYIYMHTYFDARPVSVQARPDIQLFPAATSTGLDHKSPGVREV